jgi:hypothetical protein
MTIIWYAKKSQGKAKFVCWYTNINGMERERVRHYKHKYRQPQIVPHAAIYYNKHKGAIDASDHLIRNVNHRHRHRHAYRTKGTMFLNNLLVNSYHYHNQLNNIHKSKFTLKNYTLKLLQDQYNLLITSQSIPLSPLSSLPILTKQISTKQGHCINCKNRTRKQYYQENIGQSIFLCDKHLCILTYYSLRNQLH